MDSLYGELLKAKATLQENVNEIVVLKEKKDFGSLFHKAISDCNVSLVNIKRLNAQILEREEKVKSSTNAEKIPVNSLFLKLNSLQYEKNRYAGCIEAFNSFRTKYPGIELVPETDFFQQNDAKDSGYSHSTSDPHQIMMQRLQDELSQRKSLLEKKKSLEQKKRKAETKLQEKKKFLSNLGISLKALKAACKPVKDLLGLKDSKKQETHPLLSKLPVQLFCIFSQLIYIQDVLMPEIEIGIEQEESISDGPPSKRQKRVSEKLSSDHSLFVVVSIPQSKKLKEAQKVHFHYEKEGGLVYVSTPEGISLDLGSVFPDDDGSILLEKDATLKMEEDGVNAKEMKGYPFKWAQALAAMDSTNVDQDSVGLKSILKLLQAFKVSKKA